MIKLTANGKRIDTAQIERLFTQGESFSDRIHILLPTVNNDVDVTGCTFVMRTAASDGSMTETLLTKELQEEVILLTWDVPDTVTAVAGSLRLELIGSTDSSVIIKYRMPPVYVKEAVMGTNLPVPDVIDEKLALMNQILAGMNTNTNQEVIDARTGYFSGYTYASLQQRLNAELSVCVQQSTYERNMASLAAKDSELAANYETLLREIVPARTDYDGQTWGSLGSRLGADFFAVWTSFDKRTNQINDLEARTLTTLGAPLKKNLLKNTASTVTTNGVTFTVNSDGSVTANGTATANAIFKVAAQTIQPGTYTYSGISSPSTSTVNMSVFNTADWTSITALTDSGTFTVNEAVTAEFRCVVYSGYTANNVTFYPMLRYADITDGTYEPYTKSIQEQLDELKAQITAMTTAAATTETEE